jgi:hypothetical protein
MDKANLPMAHLSEDETQLVLALRDHIGSPFIAAMTEEQQQKLKSFLQSLRVPMQPAAAIH